MSRNAAEACAGCPVHDTGALKKLGIEPGHADHVIALAGNPNTGKSTVFNAVTGLRQHTGNWPGKTVARAEGAFSLGETRYKLVDLPGTYSLMSASVDEEIARNFILFAKPDVTVVVVDANHLERNLNLVLQVLEITERVVICLNLMDEARRHGRQVDPRRLARDLGVPVVPTVARRGEGIDELLRTIAAVAAGSVRCKPYRPPPREGGDARIVERFRQRLDAAMPSLPNARWVALRLLDGDRRVAEAIRSGELCPPEASDGAATLDPELDALLEDASATRWRLGESFHDSLSEDLFTEATRFAERATRLEGTSRRFDWDRAIDDLVTSRWTGFPAMLAILTVVFWLTITGANVPSGLLSALLIDRLHPLLHQLGSSIGFPAWLSGLLFDGVFLATAWVVAVMLPPMAIFFPLFTLLEDFGYLARVSFNLDGLFQRAGAHGKQALTMSMGFGCNAAGVVAARIIDSRRERLIAIITNNFALCNGRWPTQILLATIFVGALAPAHLSGLVSAGAVVGVAVLGILLTFVVSWFLSRTFLRGEPSTFGLELPPYRPPRFWSTLYTSLIDRTLFVLWRAVIFAAPAGAVIWLSSTITIGGASIADHLVRSLDPFGVFIGLNGIILLAYIVAIPANEIVIPTVLMLTVASLRMTDVGAGAGVMFEFESAGDTAAILREAGWTLLTGVNLMLFSLMHNPCTTTIYTIWKETRSRRWTVVAALLPLVLGLVVCFVVAQFWRLGS